MSFLSLVVQKGLRYYKHKETSQLIPSVTTILSTTIKKQYINDWEKKRSLHAFRDKLASEENLDFSNTERINILMKDAFNSPSEERDEASAFGSKAHKIFSDIIQGRDTETVDEELNHVRQGKLGFQRLVV
eukprot:TRINITY_DN5476_c0_g1_i1.p1 TRINITY_DN5476_c0_g1~~TRINITY_DN5476_c0_g1_i1.p1  ORF type:complete len:131 (-),score=23.02 TRINITY_DN5476_c0_g1_i1:162-554(-)